MAPTLLRLFVILLGLSHLICLKAVPVTRTESLVQRPQVHVIQEDTNQVNTLGKWEEAITSERMDLELHDYPPSGANGRHTPRAP